MMKKILQVLSVLVMVAMLLLTMLAFAANHWVNSSMSLSEDIIITVKKGDTLHRIADGLQNNGSLSSARLLTLYARLNNKTHLEVGEYRIPQSTTPEQLLTILQSGKTISYSVTFVEGKTLKDFIQTLHQQEKIEKTLSLNYSEIIDQLGLELDHAEGWFFPDTYQYVRGMSDVDILLHAHQRMKDILEQEWEKRAENLPYKNAYEALIMASIIEKETGVPEEREEIAGVFVRRLQKGMRLQTDPTIIYGLGDDYKGNIRRKHLTQKTPYNTYVIDGLPPTPIAMPGREALYAALNPKEGKSLFFVAKGDGSHYFSETLSEHNRAVQEYQIKKRRKDYTSSPDQ